MKISEHDIKNKIHFVGIGGIGMSGIAEVMHAFGYNVQGSDIVNNQYIKQVYYFYTKKDAIKLFRKFRKEKIQ